MMAIERHAVTAAHWSIEQYDILFRASSPSRTALVIEEDTRVQGFVIVRVVGRELEIENIAVTGSARKHGFGTRLLGELLDRAKATGVETVFLEVRESNRAARALYEKWSFVESGHRKHYYKNPEEDAVLYSRVFS